MSRRTHATRTLGRRAHATRALYRRAAALATLVVFGCAATAAADYQVRGRFMYRDRAFGTSGFTGVDTDKPIRHADVQVLDDGAISLGSGATDANGNFTINVVDSQVRNVYVRVMSKTDNTAAYKLLVKQTSSSAVFALVSATYNAHPSNQDIDFTGTPVVAQQTANAATIGEPFNILDQGIDAWDFVATVNAGQRPTQLLTIFWERGSSDGTYYQIGNASIHLVGLSNDSDGYDDVVLLHEMGHYIENTMAASDNPGGQHSLNGLYDLRLSWSEGWATFFATNVRQFQGVARADIYVDTAGQPGPGQAFISYEIETPSAGVPGANNEVSVNAALWDVVDTSASHDATPVTDDDALELVNGPQDFWDVFTGYISGASSISVEDFWDGWFTPPYSKGHPTEMRTIFTARGIEYFADAFEPDGSPAQAKTVVAGSPVTHHTTYGVGDEDWTIIALQGGSPYTFETHNLKSGADTRLDLYAANGSSLLATNDDRVSGDPSSLISFTPPTSQIVYLRCKRHADQHTYGSWDLLVTGTPLPVAVSDVSLASGPDGVLLRWHADPSGNFSHFELERGAADAGPWAVLAGAPAQESGARYSYLDRDVRPGEQWFYRIVGVEATGERQAFGSFAVTATAPARYALHTPQPNPFNPTTTITFELPRASRPSLFVYTADGRLVRTLVNGSTLPAGTHTTIWDGRDAAGERVASGVYLIRLDADGEKLVRRAVLVR